MKVALYARVSTRDKEQDPETQLVALRAYAEAQGWDTQEFVDHGFSGKSLRRPEWQKMMDLVRRGRLKVVMVWHLDRAFRNVLDGLTVMRELEMLDVRFLPLEQRTWDTSTPTGKLFITFLLMMGELMTSELPAKIKAGQARARSQGKKIGRPRKYPHITQAVATEAMSANDNNAKAAAAALGIPASTLRDRLQPYWEGKEGG